MTDETPEQKLRARVMSAWPNIAKWDAAMDLYGRERYFAGKVEGLKRLDSPPAHSRTLTLQIHDAEAEYAACVAALREAK